VAGEQRRLAAILVADVVGYSKLAGSDESGTLAFLQKLRTDVIEPAIAGNAGRLFKVMGDGFLIEFASAVQAVNCARTIQQHNSSGRLPLRIGIHVGDVVVDGDDLMGDGVNIAARIEGIADAGGIAISRQVRDQVRDKLDVELVDKGEVELKNIARPVRIFTIGGARKAAEAQALALPEKPSIAVLPFQNMSGDPEQEYFADGMVEEITAALSRFRWLFVIARTSTSTFKGRTVDVKQVGRELGVRYLLEGSVRKAGNRVRITAQLIDATRGAHLWADRFEGSLENIFELQDQVASAVVGAIDPKLLAAEIARVRQTPPANINAYDLFLRASDHMYRWTDEGHETGLRLLYQAIELDPEYAEAYAWAGWCYCWRRNTRGPLDAAQVSEARRLARDAIRFGRDDGYSLAWGGYILATFADTIAEVNEGAAFIDRSLVLNANLARSWNLSGWVRIALGEPEIAIDHLARAMRLSPLDFAFHTMEAATASAHLSAHRYDEALVWAARSLRSQPNHNYALALLAMAHVLAGDLDKGRTAMTRLLQAAPNARISNFFAPYVPADRRAFFGDALRRAGMPE
jgi:adenylate cyclase